MKMLDLRYWTVLASFLLLIFIACDIEEDSQLLDTPVADPELIFDHTFEEVDAINPYRTWIRRMNLLNDEFHVEGSAYGKNRNRIQYVMEILSPAKYKRACWVSCVFIPVEGVKKINAGSREVLIDFGMGDCDREITATLDGSVRQYQHRWPGE